jgi:hypothetical protein
MFIGRRLACVTFVFGFGVLASSAQADDNDNDRVRHALAGDPFIQQTWRRPGFAFIRQARSEKASRSPPSRAVSNHSRLRMGNVAGAR